MATIPLRVSVGDQVFLQEGGEEIGAVRRVEADHLVVYIENAGDFEVKGNQVKGAHDGKLVLLPGELDAELLAAAQTAHDQESDAAHAGRLPPT